MASLVKPQININGTSREELLNQQLEVLRALHIVDLAMTQANPNGRDYQLRPEEELLARAAWNERRLAIKAMREEIEAHAIAISED